MGELRKFMDEKGARLWGKLPPKERETMMQEMKEKLPPANADWVQGFTEALAEGEEE